MTLFAMLTLAMAVGPIAWLARARIAGLRQWLVSSTAAAAMSGAALLVGPWALLSVHLRPFVVVALLAALVAAAYRSSRMAIGAKAGVHQSRLAVQSCTACLEVPDNSPGKTDPQHLSGNHVLLRCGTLRVLLAHLRRGSVALITGEPVRGGQLVGRIGNSGNTNEPHLHVSAVAADSPGPWRQAAGVPITFAGRFLSVNDVVR